MLAAASCRYRRSRPLLRFGGGDGGGDGVCGGAAARAVVFTFLSGIQARTEDGHPRQVT